MNFVARDGQSNISEVDAPGRGEGDILSTIDVSRKLRPKMSMKTAFLRRVMVGRTGRKTN